MFHELVETYKPKKRSRNTMTMAMPRCIRILTSFLLIFFVIAVWLLTAHDSHQGGNIVAEESKAFSTREALVQNVVAATAARDNRQRGRKIVVGKIVKHQELMLEKRNVAAPSEKKGSSSKMMSKQNFHKIEVAWSEEGQKRDGRSLLSEEINVGFVAFNADYHGPRHHPPKNN